MVRHVFLCLILILGLTGCGQVNITIDPKSVGESTAPVLTTSVVEATSGSTLNQTTGGLYKITASVGDAPSQAYQQTTAGYKIYVGVTGRVMSNQ